MTEWHKQKIKKRDEYWKGVQGKIFYTSKIPTCWAKALEMVGRKERKMKDVAEANRRNQINHTMQFYEQD